MTTFTGEVTVALVVEREPAWTVDYVRPRNPKDAGTRMRAIPSGRGSELIYTTLLAADTSEPSASITKPALRYETRSVSSWIGIPVAESRSERIAVFAFSICMAATNLIR